MTLARGLQLVKTTFRQIPLHIRQIGTTYKRLSTDFPTTKDEDRIVWIDMEMTGLEVEHNHILEVACVITDKHLNIVSKDLNIVVHQPDHILNSMNEWCLINHAKSGLISESRVSKMSVEDTEQELINFLARYVPMRSCPMAGNSVYMDRIFLNKYMPTAADYLHHRLIDVSTIKELVSKWNLEVPKMDKVYEHRALPDIKESIGELRLFMNYILSRRK